MRELYGFLRAMRAHTRALVSGAIATILPILWPRVAEWIGKREWGTDVPWLLVLLLGSLTLLIAAFLAWRDEHRVVETQRQKLRPKLKCSFSASNPGCVMRNIKLGVRDGKELKGTFYRVKVEADSVIQVDSCSGRLRSIKRDGTEVFSGQPCRLPFTPSERPDAVNKTIHENEPEYLDCVLVTNDNKVFIWASDQEGQRGPKYGHLLETPGDYEFNISVVSSAPTCFVPPLIFKWRGSQQSAEMICPAANT
jgi:hypothetical protein